jgi:hypothetical protein
MPVSNLFITLDPAVCGALSLNHGGLLTVQGAIQVNSTCPTGALQAGGGSHILASPGIVGVVGGTSLPGGSTVSPAVVRNSALADPLASLPIPTLAGLPVYGPVNCTSPTTTLNPGVYPSIRTSNNCSLVLTAGDYIVGSSAGSFSLTNGSVVIGSGAGNTTIVLLNGMSISGGMTLSGTNVLFYNSCLSYAVRLPAGCLSTDTFAPLTFSNNNDMSDILPPASGTYAQMTYFQDRANPAPMTIDPGIFAAGRIYGKSMPVTIGSGAVVPVMFVVASVHIDASTVNAALP